MNRIQRARPLLGTLVRITAEGAQPADELHAAVSAAFTEVARVHALMSYHEPDSELTRVNRGALESRQALHPHTRTVLAAALEMARLSAGAFDPSIAVQLTRWGLLPRPGPTAPLATTGAASWRDVELDSEGVRFHRPLWLDLGGIAKGFAVDVALECLMKRGVRSIVVNAGGDLRVAGERRHTVAVRHPRHAHAPAHELSLCNEALATSSAFESRRESSAGTFSALVDPHSGHCYCGGDSISVRAPTCMSADALTKVALFAAPDVAESVFLTCQAHGIRLRTQPAVT